MDTETLLFRVIIFLFITELVIITRISMTEEDQLHDLRVTLIYIL